jgi:hypothetical protein
MCNTRCWYWWWSRIELILCKFEGIWTPTRLPQKRLIEGSIENALQYKELAIYAIWPLWPWKVGQMKILVLRNVVFLRSNQNKNCIILASNVHEARVGFHKVPPMRSKIIETAKRHIATIRPSYHQKMKSLASMLNPFTTGPFLTRVLKPKYSILKIFFNELLWPNLMKESETVCFIKLTTNCTLFSHKKFQPSKYAN